MNNILDTTQLTGVIDTDDEIIATIEPEVTIEITLIDSGLPGLPGGIGPVGPPGPSYTHPEKHSADIIDETEEKNFLTLEEKLRLAGFIHEQQVSSAIWLVNHNLDKYPSVSVVDTGNNVVMGNIEYISRSQLIVSFSSEFSGKAYLN